MSPATLKVSVPPVRALESKVNPASPVISSTPTPIFAIRISPVFPPGVTEISGWVVLLLPIPIEVPADKLVLFVSMVPWWKNPWVDAITPAAAILPLALIPPSTVSFSFGVVVPIPILSVPPLTKNTSVSSSDSILKSTSPLPSLITTSSVPPSIKEINFLPPAKKSIWSVLNAIFVSLSPSWIILSCISMSFDAVIEKPFILRPSVAVWLPKLSALPPPPPPSPP